MKRIFFSRSVLWVLVIGVAAMLPQVSKAGTGYNWTLYVGAENKDQGKQADAMLPNEAWILAGDSIKWQWQPKNEPHTVTLLTPGGLRPAPPGPGPQFGCAPNTSPATYTGTACVDSGPLTGGGSFTVSFPNSGNYKFVCIFHTNMNGTVHVLPAGSALPYIQSDYDRQAKDQAEDILGDFDSPTEEVKDFPRSKNEVLMVGELTATGGGRQYLAIVRFFPETIYISKGETVEFTNADPEEPHTVTSGKDDSLTNDQAPVGLGTPASDLALTATATSTSSPTWGNATAATGVNSGFLQASPEDAVNRAQAAPGITRIRITFNATGTFYYHCALHDTDGMQGKVVVK